MIRILLIIPLLLISVASATPQCEHPTEDWFLHNVVSKTNNVVYSEILPSSDLKDKKRIKVLKNITYEDKNSAIKINSILVIGNWWTEPRAENNAYKKQNVILFLSNDGDHGYRLSNDNWKKCRPSIINEISINKFKIPLQKNSIKGDFNTIEKAIKELEFQC